MRGFFFGLAKFLIFGGVLPLIIVELLLRVVSPGMAACLFLVVMVVVLLVMQIVEKHCLTEEAMMSIKKRNKLLAAVGQRVGSGKNLWKERNIQRDKIVAEWEKTAPKAIVRMKWAWIWATLMTMLGMPVVMIRSCSQISDYIAEEYPTPQSKFFSQLDDVHWDAANIKLPHLDDSLLYVSNPDGIISDNTVDIVNRTMRRLDTELGVESAVVVVGHVQDADIFTFCQDLFDLYGIGRNDQGLVVTLAYGDHLIRSHTGRNLEVELTDAECSRLQGAYAVPFLKLEQPDSAIIYLTEAIYSLLNYKNMVSIEDNGSKLSDNMPKLTIVNESPVDEASDEEDTQYTLFGVLVFMLIPALITVMLVEEKKDKLYAWNVNETDPYAKSKSRGGSSGGSYSSYSSSSKSGGGGYGGGRSGGGGATSSW